MNGFSIPNVTDQPVPVSIRQADIAHQDVGPLRVDHLHRLSDRRRRSDAGAHLRQHQRRESAAIRVVVDDQDAEIVEPRQTRHGRGHRRRGPSFADHPGRRRPTDPNLGRPRKTHGERRAAPDALAGRVHGSSVQLDELPNDGQPETESGMAPGHRAVSLAETIEHVRQEHRIDALAGIDNLDLQIVFRGYDEEIDATALGRELDRVREQIPDHLLEPANVSVHGPHGREIGGQRQLHVPGRSQRPDGLQRRLRHGDKIDREQRHAERARNDA